VNVKFMLLAAGTLAGSTVMVPRPPAGQVTVTGAATSKLFGGGLWNCSVAVKLAEAAEPGGVAWIWSVNVLAPGRSTTWNCVLELTPSEQSEFRQARSEDDGGIAVQPGGTDTVTITN
jgi:hypothetical protein